jgi:hypothetical protein
VAAIILVRVVAINGIQAAISFGEGDTSVISALLCNPCYSGWRICRWAGSVIHVGNGVIGWGFWRRLCLFNLRRFGLCCRCVGWLLIRFFRGFFLFFLFFWVLCVQTSRVFSVRGIFRGTLVIVFTIGRWRCWWILWRLFRWFGGHGGRESRWGRRRRGFFVVSSFGGACDLGGISRRFSNGLAERRKELGNRGGAVVAFSAVLHRLRSPGDQRGVLVAAAGEASATEAFATGCAAFTPWSVPLLDRDRA